MPREGKKSFRGWGIFARASRAQDQIILPPLANFSATPLVRIFIFSSQVCVSFIHHKPGFLPRRIIEKGSAGIKTCKFQNRL